LNRKKHIPVIAISLVLFCSVTCSKTSVPDSPITDFETLSFKFHEPTLGQSSTNNLELKELEFGNFTLKVDLPKTMIQDIRKDENVFSFIDSISFPDLKHLDGFSIRKTDNIHMQIFRAEYISDTSALGYYEDRKLNLSMVAKATGGSAMNLPDYETYDTLDKCDQIITELVHRRDIKNVPDHSEAKSIEIHSYSDYDGGVLRVSFSVGSYEDSSFVNLAHTVLKSVRIIDNPE